MQFNPPPFDPPPLVFFTHVHLLLGWLRGGYLHLGWGVRNGCGAKIGKDNPRGGRGFVGVS